MIPERPIPLGRRGALALLGSLLPAAVRAAPNAAPASAFPNGATMLVAGPQSSNTDRWAEWLTPLIARNLAPGLQLRRQAVGGADGVTGANQFDARVTPDGTTAMLLPGQAALDWLVGDPRAQFDAAHWVPALAGIGCGVVVGWLPPGGLASDTRLRVGAAGPAGPDLPALLGLELAGLDFAPVFGLATQEAVAGALRQRAVDLAFLHGQTVPARLAELARSGATPLFALGTLNDTDRVVRDPQLPDVQTLPELCTRLHGMSPAGPLWDAWVAAASAAQLDVGLVLPQLTPAAMVALWRSACRSAVAAPELQAAIAPLGLRAVGSPVATACAGAVAVDAPALLALRRWLATRFDWRPS
jgi:hypothetical protein